MEININDKIKYFINQADDDNNYSGVLIQTGIVFAKLRCCRTNKFFYHVNKTNLSYFSIRHDAIITKLDNSID